MSTRSFVPSRLRTESHDRGPGPARRMVFWVLAVLALFSLQGIASCPGPDEPCVGEGEVVAVLTAEDSGEALDICIADRFEFTFNYAGNAAFEYMITDLDRTVVEQVDSYADPPPPGCYDCPSLVHWVFEGMASGETLLEISIVGLDGEILDVYSFYISVG